MPAFASRISPKVWIAVGSLAVIALLGLVGNFGLARWNEHKATQLFTEANQLVQRGQAAEATSYNEAFNYYKAALDNAQKILRDYPSTSPAARLLQEPTLGLHTLKELQETVVPEVLENAGMESDPRSDVPAAPTPAATPPGTTQPDPPLSDPAQLIRVRTDVLDVVINKQGAVMEHVKLLTYPVAADSSNQPLLLLQNIPGRYFVAQGGFRSNQPAPDHHALYTAETSHFALGEGEDQAEVTLRWRSPEGLQVSKVFTFRRGTFLVHIRYEIKNEGTATWFGRMYSQLQRNTTTDSGGLIYTYSGVAISSPEKRYEKIKYEELVERPLDRDITGGWAANLQHYSLAALIPDPKIPYHYYSLVPKASDRYVVGMLGPEVQVSSGGEAVTRIDLYVGPKLQHLLEGLAPGLQLTVD